MIAILRKSVNRRKENLYDCETNKKKRRIDFKLEIKCK